jgi:nitrate/nitrite transporter NarK
MKPIVRSILAVITGYLLLAVLIGVVDFGLSLISPDQYPNGAHPAAKWLIVELAVGVCLLVAGGYLTAKIARRSEMRHVLALGILAAVMAAVSLLVYQNRQPVWFQLVFLICAIPATLTGGRLKTRH